MELWKWETCSLIVALFKFCYTFYPTFSFCSPSLEETTKYWPGSSGLGFLRILTVAPAYFCKIC